MGFRGKSLLYMGIIIAIASFLRFRYVIYTPFEFKIDAWSMHQYALNVAKGEYYGRLFGEHWARYAYWPPLYIFLSGFAYKLFGMEQDFLIMRLIQAGFSVASCLLCFSIAAEALKGCSPLNREAGLASGILMALNPRMVVYTNHLYVETIFITFYLLLALSGLRYLKYELPLKADPHNGRKSIRHLLLFSLLLGIGNLIRPVLLLLPGLMAVSALLFAAAKRLDIRRSVRVILMDGAFSIAIMLLVFSPWMIRNYLVTGRLILVDTNGPINFYIAHNPLAKGQWVDVKPHTDINKLYEIGYKEGFVYIIHNISREMNLLKHKQRLFLYQGDPHISEAESFLSKAYKLSLYGGRGVFGSTFYLPQISFVSLWKVALLLLLIFGVRLAGAKVPLIIVREPAWIIGNFFYVNLIVQIFYFAPRYRIIAEPFLCIAAGVFAAGLLTPFPK